MQVREPRRCIQAPLRINLTHAATRSRQVTALLCPQLEARGGVDAHSHCQATALHLLRVCAHVCVRLCRERVMAGGVGGGKARHMYMYGLSTLYPSSALLSSLDLAR